MLDFSRLDAVHCTTALEVELLAALVIERRKRMLCAPAPPPPPPPEPEPLPPPRLVVEMPAAFAVNTHRLPPDRVVACTATMHQIQAAVSQQFKIPIAQLKGQQRSREIMMARQVAYCLCAVLTGSSLVAVGRVFGDRDHTTVLHAMRKLTWLNKDLNECLTPADTLVTWVKHAHRIALQRPDRWKYDPAPDVVEIPAFLSPRTSESV